MTNVVLSAAEDAAGQPHVFTAAAVSSHVTGITFRVRAKDNDGHYSSGVTVSMTILAIAYNQQEVGVDTNIERIGFRLLGLKKKSRFNIVSVLKLMNVNFFITMSKII